MSTAHEAAHVQVAGRLPLALVDGSVTQASGNLHSLGCRLLRSLYRDANDGTRPRPPLLPRASLEIADIFRNFGPAWRRANAGHVSLGQLKVMSAIERCRTAAPGGHVARCENAGCGHTIVAYNSCRNRHCPKCQGLRRGSGWKSARRSFCPCRTFMWSTRCPRPSPPLLIRTRPRSTASCSRPRPKPPSRSPPIPSALVPGSALRPCCTRAHSGEVVRGSPPGVRAH